MIYAYTRPRYQVSVFRTIGPLVFEVLPFTDKKRHGVVRYVKTFKYQNTVASFLIGKR